MRQGAQAAGGRASASPPPSARARPAARVRYDFQAGAPGRVVVPARGLGCAACARRVTEITVADLGYGDAFGVAALRDGLADYLGRVRGVVADRSRVVVTNGYCRASA